MMIILYFEINKKITLVSHMFYSYIKQTQQTCTDLNITN